MSTVLVSAGLTVVSAPAALATQSPPPPTLTSVSPATGPLAGGGNLILTGTNLTSATSVTVRGTGCTSFTVDSATRVTCVLPSLSAGGADVAVVTGGGSDYLPHAYTYVVGPAITSVSPASGPAAGGGNLVLTGTHLTGATAVTVGRTACTSLTVDSATQVTCVLPAHSAGGADVGVTTPGGSYTQENVYTYIAAPTITSVSPTSGPAAGGGSLVLTGTHLNGATAVTVGGTACTALTVDSPTQVTCVLPAGSAGSADVAVTTPGGSGTLPAAYTYIAAPAPIVINTVPGAPTHLVAVGQNEQIGLRFSPPTSDGGSAITAYQVRINGGRTWRTVTTRPGPHGVRTATVTGLKNGVTYSVRVRAVNSIGAGAASGARKAVPNAPRLGNVRRSPASETPVPAHPWTYLGTAKFTKARDTSHNGTWAHPMSRVGKRQLTVGEAATLDQSGLFGFDSAVLTKAARAEVKALAGHLRLAHVVLCEGYTDYAGNPTHQQWLSTRRAQAVCAALVQYGAHVRTTSRGYGGLRPVVVGGTPFARVGNRRVVVLVTR